MSEEDLPLPKKPAAPSVETIGDGPVPDELRPLLNELAILIDAALNGSEKQLGNLVVPPANQKRYGFCLMVSEFGRAHHGSRQAYISNTSRKDVVRLLRDQLQRFSEQAESARQERIRNRRAHRQGGNGRG